MSAFVASKYPFLFVSLCLCPSGGQCYARLPQLHERKSAGPRAGGRHRGVAGCLRGCNQKPQRTFLPGYVAKLEQSFTFSSIKCRRNEFSDAEEN